MSSEILNASEILGTTRTLKPSPRRDYSLLWLGILGHSLCGSLAAGGVVVRFRFPMVSSLVSPTQRTRLHLQAIPTPIHAMNVRTLPIRDGQRGPAVPC
jgi:hypothetical protein